MTVTIPLKPQRKDFGCVRFCIDNSTRQGTHAGARASAHGHRVHDPALDILYAPGGYVDYPEEYTQQYEEYLLPLCDTEEEDDPESMRGIVYPEAEVGDAVIYEATAMHQSTPNVQHEHRDVIAITYAWRGCSAANEEAEEPEPGHVWGCGECYHCVNMGGWSDSPFGENGPNDLRHRIADNYFARSKLSSRMMAEARATPEYATAMLKLGSPVITKQ